MASRFERISSAPSSNDPRHALPSSTSLPKADLPLPAHLQPRPPPSRSSSANPHRSSHVPSSGHPHKLSQFSPHHPGLDLNLNMLVHPPRFHSPLPHPSHGVPSRGPAGNRLSMQPSQSQPSLQTFLPRDQRRETFQSHATAPSGQFGHHSNRQSRHMEPFRRSDEPANLIQSVRDTPQSSRPNSVQVHARRVVTGVLQSALPPSSRPDPINTAPVRSMSIAELEHRHKAALRQLQTHSNQHVPRPPKAQSSPSKPPTTKSNNLERHHRHKAAMHKLQAHSIPPAVAVANPQASAHRRSVQPPPKAVVQPKPPATVSDSSSKSAKADEPAKSPEKPSGSTSSRRSLFGFWSHKEPSKSAAMSGEELSAKSKTPKMTKKQKKEASKSAADKVEEDNKEEDEDEDVPLAQLAGRRSSYNPAAFSQPTAFDSHLAKSYSVPGMMHTMSSHTSSPEPGARPSDRPQHPRSLTNPIDNRPSRRSSHSAGGFQAIREGNEAVAANSSIAGHPASPFRPPPWLDAGLDSPGGDRRGPRPLIFEDEAKAIRNSRRLWA